MPRLTYVAVIFNDDDDHDCYTGEMNGITKFMVDFSFRFSLDLILKFGDRRRIIVTSKKDRAGKDFVSVLRWCC